VGRKRRRTVTDRPERAPGWGSATFTSDFRHEYEAERERWIRKRFLWYTGVVSILQSLPVLVGLLAWLLIGQDKRAKTTMSWSEVIGSGIAASIFLAVHIHARRGRPGREAVVRLTYVLIVLAGLLKLGAIMVTRSMGMEMPVGVGAAWIGSIFATHIFACMFLPLTPLEAVRPLVPLLVVFTGFSIFAGNDEPLTRVVAIACAPLIGVPGCLICWWRNSRFRDRFFTRQLRGRYAELRHELMSARQIHESLFPRPCTDGPVRFDYIYEPMRQIGGDYLYACFTPGTSGGRVLNVALLDVTGHGIPAALTVNRLHGEMERIFAERPETRPGELLMLLNRYVHLTLATHSVYVTALCLRVDPDDDSLEYASGGHPPAYLRAVDGTIERLDSTALVLGACAGPDFHAEPRRLRFGAGDALIAYTDGATEARDAGGRYLGIDGIQRVLASDAAAHASQGAGWPALVARAVEAHRHGPIADDTLVIEVRRTLPGPAARPAPRTGAAAAV
jgi:serine phosphatase RsbU (regulator of sigma subunit)